MANSHIELDHGMIEGALGLMAVASGNNLDQETIRKAEQLKRIVDQRLEDEFRESNRKSNPEQKSQTSDQASTSRAEPGPSSRVLDQPAYTSRVEPRPSSAIIGSEEVKRPRARSSLPAAIRDFVGIRSMPIQKQIVAGDVNPSLYRLKLPTLPVKKNLKRMHLKRNENVQRGILVTVYGPDGREYAMKLRIWAGKHYVLNNKNWNQFCQDYGLPSLVNKATLTIWMFRHRETDDLCFAITW